MRKKFKATINEQALETMHHRYNASGQPEVFRSINIGVRRVAKDVLDPAHGALAQAFLCAVNKTPLQ